MLNTNQINEVIRYFNQFMSDKYGRQFKCRESKSATDAINSLEWDVDTCRSFIRENHSEECQNLESLFIRDKMMRWFMGYEGQGTPEHGVDDYGQEQGEAQEQAGAGVDGEQQDGQQAQGEKVEEKGEEEMTPQEKFAKKMKELEEEAKRKAQMAEEELKRELEEEERKKEEEKRKQEPVKHAAYDRIKFWVMKNQPVLLVGPAGSGKTFICQQIAEELGRKFYMNTSIQDSVDVLGYERSNGTFKETEVYKAMKESKNPDGNGSIYCADEFDGYDANALLATNSISANRYATFGNEEFVKAGEKFEFIGTANTFGTGADMQYSGRNQLDAATLNRFVRIYVDYDARIEESKTSSPEILEFLREFRRVVNTNKMNYIVSYREITKFDIALDGRAFGYKDLSNVVQDCLTNGIDPNDLRCIETEMNCKENPYYKALKKVVKAQQ